MYFSLLGDLFQWNFVNYIYRYMLAEGLGLSGIVSILFTGMVSAIAVYHVVWFMLVLWLYLTHFIFILRS